jgi:hypothetical protein
VCFLCWAFLIPFGFAGYQIVYFSDKLPPVIAMHFGAYGVANRWGSPWAFPGTYSALLMVITLMFFAMPAFVRRVPAKWVTLPNCDDWLAPERKEAAIAFMQRWHYGFGLTSLCFLVYVFHLTLDSSLHQPTILPNSPLMTALILSLFAAPIWVLALRAPFLKKNDSRP